MFFFSKKLGRGGFSLGPLVRSSYPCRCPPLPQILAPALPTAITPSTEGVQSKLARGQYAGSMQSTDGSKAFIDSLCCFFFCEFSSSKQTMARSLTPASIGDGPSPTLS